MTNGYRGFLFIAWLVTLVTVRLIGLFFQSKFQLRRLKPGASAGIGRGSSRQIVLNCRMEFRIEEESAFPEAENQDRLPLWTRSIVTRVPIGPLTGPIGLFFQLNYQLPGLKPGAYAGIGRGGSRQIVLNCRMEFRIEGVGPLTAPIGLFFQLKFQLPRRSSRQIVLNFRMEFRIEGESAFPEAENQDRLPLSLTSIFTRSPIGPVKGPIEIFSQLNFRIDLPKK